MTTSIFNEFQTQVPYTSPVKAPVAQTTVSEAVPATKTTNSDSIEISTKNKKEKKGLIAGAKELVANVKKFFLTTGIYLKGTAKGLGIGAIAGSIVYGATEVYNGFKGKGFKGKQNILGITLGAVTTLATLAGHLWTASLDATEKQSEIDHRYIGH